MYARNHDRVLHHLTIIVLIRVHCDPVQAASDAWFNGQDVNPSHAMEALWHRAMGEPWHSERPNVTRMYPGGVPWPEIAAEWSNFGKMYSG